MIIGWRNQSRIRLIQTVDKPMLPKFDTHGESARGDWLFPLAIDIIKNENFLGEFSFLIFKLSTLCRQLERMAARLISGRPSFCAVGKE